MHRHFEDRHPVLASLLGGVGGFALGVVVLVGLLLLAFLVDPIGRVEGKGGPIVEAMWAYFGIPICFLIGLFWPHTIGRLFRDAQPACGRMLARAEAGVEPVTSEASRDR